VDCPAASRPEGQAFTLVELLVVVAILAVLVAVLLPELSATRSLARSAQCRHNLRQIATAFHAAEATPSSTTETGKRYDPDRWPGVPMNVCSEPKVFLCPEDPDATPGLSALVYRSGEHYGPVEVAFSDAVPRPAGWTAGTFPGAYCMYDRHDDEGYTEFYLEDWLAEKGSDFDYWDSVIRVYDGPPCYGEVQPMGSTGSTNSLWLGAQCLFVDLRNHYGKTFPLPGGQTNYAINAKVGRQQVAPDTIVLLDYRCELIADPDGDILERLVDSARHRGRLNVLFADESVGAYGPTACDPHVRGEMWSP